MYLSKILILLLCAIKSLAWQSIMKAINDVSIEELSKTERVFPPPELAYVNSSPKDRLLRPFLFRVLMDGSDHIIVGSRNSVYNLTLSDLSENMKLIWEPTEIEHERCKQLYSSESYAHERYLCHNYIRVFARHLGSYFICGTHSRVPKCRRYVADPDTQELKMLGPETLDGRGRAPFDPKYNNTFLVIGKKYYTGVELKTDSHQVSFVRVDASKPSGDTANVLWISGEDASLFSRAQFVKQTDYNDKVYFFFRENNVPNNAPISRIGRICKGDNGASAKARQSGGMDGRFTTYLKSTLDCSMGSPTQSVYSASETESFSFPLLQSVSKIQKKVMSGMSKDVFYGVFTTPYNSISGSAVCLFDMHSVDSVFHGRFFDRSRPQRTSGRSWPFNHEHIHPGRQCPSDTRNMSRQQLDFILNHPLMQNKVRPVYKKPVIIQTADGRFSSIVVDWKVPISTSIGGQKFVDLLFLGTECGKVLKFFVDTESIDAEPIFIEKIQVLPLGTPIAQLRLFKSEDGLTQKLTIISANEIKNIPLHRCETHLTCGRCIHSRDPYCRWDQMKGECGAFATKGLQNVTTGTSPKCPKEDTVLPEISDRMTAGFTCQPCICNEIEDNLKLNYSFIWPLLNATQTPSTPLFLLPDSEQNNRKDESEQVMSAPHTANNEADGSFSSLTLVIVILGCLLISFVFGFGFGLFYTRYRKRHLNSLPQCLPSSNTLQSSRDDLAYKSNLKKTHGLGSSGSVPQLVVNNLNNAPFKPNSLAETKIQNNEIINTSKSVYL